MKMTHAHAVVWLDHHEAHIIQFNADTHEDQRIKHHGNDRAAEFYHAIAATLKGVSEILIAGPSSAKTELIKHLESHDPAIAKAVLGVESADHPTDGQLLAHARSYFKAKDRMLAH